MEKEEARGGREPPLKKKNDSSPAIFCCGGGLSGLEFRNALGRWIRIFGMNGIECVWFGHDNRGHHEQLEQKFHFFIKIMNIIVQNRISKISIPN